MHSDIERQAQMADRLRKVPHDAQPPYDWLEYRRREQIRAAGNDARPNVSLSFVAVAATLMLLVVGSIVLLGHRRATHVVAHRPPPVEMLDSAAAERWLSNLPPEPVIVRFGTRVAVTSLEDRIAQVDDLLTAANFEGSQPARIAALREERGVLVTSLVQVRYAEALAANAAQ
jgi:hypothetical protein